MVQFGQGAERQEVPQCRGHDDRNRRAARHVHHGLVRNQILHGNRAGRVRVGTRDAAKGGAGTDRDNGGCSRDGLAQHVDVADAGNRRVARVAERNRAVDEHEVAVRVLFHRRVARRFSLVAGRRLQRVVIIERDGVEDQPFDGRRRRAGQRFGAPGAFLERQPDDRRPPRIFDGLRDTRDHRRR